MTEDEIRTVFASKRTDEGTKIIGETYREIEGIPVCFEQWTWEQVLAMAMVLPADRFEGQPDEEIMAWVRKHVAIVDRHTFSRKADFIFVCYGFDELDWP